MVHKRIADKKQCSIGVSIGIGLGAAVVISIMGSVIVASMLIHETIAVSSMKFLALAIQFLATVIGDIIACKLAKGKYALIAGLTTVLYCFLLIAVSVLVYDSMFTSFWTSIFSISLGFAASCAICIIKSTKQKNRKHAHR